MTDFWIEHMRRHSEKNPKAPKGSLEFGLLHLPLSEIGFQFFDLKDKSGNDWLMSGRKLYDITLGQDC